MRSWYSTCTAQLLFADFYEEIHGAYLPGDWERIAMCIELLTTAQGNNTFWDFSVLMQSKNSLLHNTTSYLKEEQVYHI